MSPDATQEWVLREVVDVFERRDVAYMIVGSFASSTWGQPRSTQDADVVVALDAEGLRDLEEAVRSRFSLPRDAAREAVRTKRMFNLVHFDSAAKVDLILPANDFDLAALRRRVAGTLAGRPAWFISPEDAILAKLRWMEAGAGELHRRDCIGIVRVQGARLDRDYLRRTAAELGLTGRLDDLLAASD